LINSPLPDNRTIDQAIQCSAQILAAVESEKLDAIPDLYNQRQALIDRAYANTQVAAEDTRMLLDLNQQIVRKLSLLQQHTQRAQIDLSQAAKATSAYQAVASDSKKR
jgi:uncharacterized protein (DUF342 family)